MRWPISFKLALTYLGVVCLAGAPVLVLLDRELTASLRERRDHELLTRARLIAALLAADPAAQLDAQVAVLDPVADRLAAIADSRVTLIAPDGRVAGDSALDPPAILGLDNHLARPEVRDALARGAGSSSRRSRTTGEVFRYAAVPFATAAGTGVVRLAVPHAGIEAPLRATRGRVLVAGALALALGFVLSLVVGRAVSAPLRAMTRIATQLAAGSMAERVRVRSGSDELADLADALNRLSGDLARTMGQLQSEKGQLRAVLEGMAEGVLLIDRGGRILLANRAATSFLPHGESAISRTPLEVTRSAELDALVRAAQASGGAERGQVGVGGGARTFDASVIPLAEPAGGLVVVLHDITEVKRLETVRREFAANISHELRTPLTAIRGFIDTLKDDSELAEAERTRFLDAASRHAVRLSNLVHDLFALSRLDSPEFKLDLVPCSLEAEIARALELHETRARERGLRLAADLEPGLPPVLADQAGLEQILSNLIDNAIKYNRPGGSVVVRAARAGLFAQVEVEDTGVGIAGQHVPRIFERLYRVDPGRSRAEGGTGLGLAIVKHLVLKHGGDVWVTSEPGRGSTFHFTLHFAPGGQGTGERGLGL